MSRFAVVPPERLRESAGRPSKAPGPLPGPAAPAKLLRMESRADGEGLRIVPAEGSVSVDRFSRNRILALYRQRYRVPPELEAEFEPFELRETTVSRLVYAWPMRPGSPRFYAWVVQQPRYYRAHRWEYDGIAEEAARFEAEAPFLDVGCGAGNLLRVLRDRTPVRAVGLDTTPQSVERCREAGFEAEVGTLQDHADRAAHRGRYAGISLTHVLEHVADPVGTVKAGLELLRPGGVLFLSTPYSPLSAEQARYDPLNLPPHHVTRWRLTTYQHLAEAVGGVDLSVRMPRRSAFGHCRRAAWYRAVPSETTTMWSSAARAASLPVVGARVATAWLLDAKLRRSARAWVRDRDRVNGQIATDVILAMLRLPG